MEVLNNSRYQTEHSQSNPTISHYSNIRSSVPYLKGRNNLGVPNFNPGLVTQGDPRISHFSRISHQGGGGPSNSRFHQHVVQKSVVNNPSIMVNRQHHHHQVKKTSRSPVPAAYATPIVREVMVSPQRREHHHIHRQEVKNVVSQKNYSPKKVNHANSSVHHSKSLGKSVTYTIPQQHYTKAVHQQQQSEGMRLPTPLDARQITKIEYASGRNIQQQ